MTREVRWTRAALADLSGIVDHIARENPAAARKVATAIRTAADKLGVRPIGRRGRVPDTFERPLTPLPYILAYTIQDDPGGGSGDLIILHVIHMARNWPPGRWPR